MRGVVLQVSRSARGVRFGGHSEVEKFILGWFGFRSAGLQRLWTRLSHTSSHGAVSLCLQLLPLCLEQSSRAGTDGLLGIRIVEAHKEKRYVVFPGYATEAAEVWYGQNIPVAILLVANLQLLKIRHVVHVPTVDDRAEAKPACCDREELLLGDKLTTQETDDNDTTKQDQRNKNKQIGKRLGGDFFWFLIRSLGRHFDAGGSSRRASGTRAGTMSEDRAPQAEVRWNRLRGS